MWGRKKLESTKPAVSNPPEARRPGSLPASLEGTAASNDATRPLGATSDRATARLGANLHVKGDISGNEDLRIDGSVEGLIQLEDCKLTIGPGAKVTADVVAPEIVVHGSVTGNLRARDRIEIKREGSVIGDLITAHIMIEDGAYLKGSVEIDHNVEGEIDLDQPTFIRAAQKSA